jgi:hypothetical protein
MGLRPAPDSKISNFDHNGALTIRNFMLMAKTPSNYSFKHFCYGHDPIKKDSAVEMTKRVLINQFKFRLKSQKASKRPLLVFIPL